MGGLGRTEGIDAQVRAVGVATSTPNMQVARTGLYHRHRQRNGWLMQPRQACCWRSDNDTVSCPWIVAVVIVVLDKALSS